MHSVCCFQTIILKVPGLDLLERCSVGAVSFLVNYHKESLESKVFRSYTYGLRSAILSANSPSCVEVKCHNLYHGQTPAVKV